MARISQYPRGITTIFTRICLMTAGMALTMALSACGSPSDTSTSAPTVTVVTQATSTTVPIPPTDTAALAPPTDTVVAAPTSTAPTLSRYLEDVIKFAPNPKFTIDGEKVRVVAQVTNTDSVSHDINAQANFYRIPLRQLGGDPADYLVTAGYTDLTLTAGEKRTIQIEATNVTTDPIVSVDFSVIGK